MKSKKIPLKNLLIGAAVAAASLYTYKNRDTVRRKVAALLGKPLLAVAKLPSLPPATESLAIKKNVLVAIKK